MQRGYGYIKRLRWCFFEVVFWVISLGVGGCLGAGQAFHAKPSPSPSAANSTRHPRRSARKGKLHVHSSIRAQTRAPHEHAGHLGPDEFRTPRCAGPGLHHGRLDQAGRSAAGIRPGVVARERFYQPRPVDGHGHRSQASD
jgi:hypothetical protein